MHNPGARFHHFELWEDWQTGMYGSRFRRNVVSESIELLRNPTAFRRVLRDVAEAWPVATWQHLSDFCRNHQPSCGRLACAYEFGATIREVNEAWAFLSWPEQRAANEVADYHTYSWREDNMKGSQLSWPI